MTQPIRYITLIILVFYCSKSSAQPTTIASTNFLTELCDTNIYVEPENFFWKINQIEIKPSIVPVEIYPNYPKIDTIIFFNYPGTKNDTVYTRIPPHKDYMFSVASLDYFNIYEKQKWLNIENKLENDTTSGWSYSDSISREIMESGTVKLKVKNKPKSDSLFFVYSDVWDYPYFYGSIIDAKTSSLWLSPLVGWYETSNHFVIIARLQSNDVQYDSEDSNICITKYENLDILFKTRIRIFNNEKVKIVFDYETKKAKIKFK